MKALAAAAGLLVLSVFTPIKGQSQSTQTFAGRITDSMCLTGDHSYMRMGSTDAECTAACIDSHGALYMLAAEKEQYGLSDQERPAAFAGQRVRVTGTLDAKTKTIQVDSIAQVK